MSALLTDLYQLTMLQAYLEEGLDQPAVFELFVRRLPPQRRFLVAAGLEQALEFLEHLRFTADEIRWLEDQRKFSPQLLRRLAGLRFEGDVDAMREGTVFFANEPILRVTAPLPQAQLVESRLLNIVHFQTLIASKASRVVLAAKGRQLVDFGMRRAHGEEAALMAARAAFIAGFDATATIEAGRRFGIPVAGTMAHSFVQAHSSELAAFEAFMSAWPNRATLLVDTYDTEAAVRQLIASCPRWRARGLQFGGVRLDSGDLRAQAFAVRRLLNAAGLPDVTIFASGNLDEHRVASLVGEGAPINGFGVGTALDTSSDVPALDAVYKLQAYAGAARRKRSQGKATWPGAKQVSRTLDAEAILLRDRLHLADERVDGVPLLVPCMRAGKRLRAPEPLVAARRFHAEQRSSLRPSLCGLEPSDEVFGPEVSDAIRELAAQIDAESSREAAG